MKYHILLLALGVSILSQVIPTAAHAAGPGDVIKCPDFSAVYYVADDGKRWVFPNDKIYFSWYSDFSEVITVSCQELATFAIGQNVPYQAGTRLVKLQSVPTVYVVAPGGVLHPIDSESRAIELYGADWASRVDDLSDAFFPRYEVHETVPSTGYPDGTIIKNSETGTFYYVEDGARRQIPSGSISSTLASFALTRTAPFDGTSTGTTLTSQEWVAYGKLDREGADAPVVAEEPTDFAKPVVSVNTDLVLNGEPYVISWTDIDPSNTSLTYQLQEDTSINFSSPLLVVNARDFDYKGEKESQVNPKYYYRARVTDGVTSGPWSEPVRVDIRNEYHLENVPSITAPTSGKIGVSDTTSTSVPIAAANILYYLDQMVQNTHAIGVTAGKSVKDLGDYLAWFMNVNGVGSEDRVNVDDPGVYNADIKPGLDEFISWDGDEDPWQGFEAPQSLSNKTDYNNWDVEEIRQGLVSESSALSQIANALKDGFPVLGVFYYWNPVATGDMLNEIRFYEMGSSINDSSDSGYGLTAGVPKEYWNVSVSNSGVGHGVTVIGYIPNYDVTPDDDEDDKEDYLVIYDGWSATFSLMAVPLDQWSRFYILTPQASSGPTSSPSLSLVTAVDSGNLFTVSWDSVSKATHYELQWDTNDTFSSPDSFVTTAFDGVTDYTETFVVSEKTKYYYRVRGLSEYGNGDWSSTKSITVNP